MDYTTYNSITRGSLIFQYQALHSLPVVDHVLLVVFWEGLKCTLLKIVNQIKKIYYFKLGKGFDFFHTWEKLWWETGAPIATLKKQRRKKENKTPGRKLKSLLWFTQLPFIKC